MCAGTMLTGTVMQATITTPACMFLPEWISASDEKDSVSLPGLAQARGVKTAPLCFMEQRFK